MNAAERATAARELVTARGAELRRVEQERDYARTAVDVAKLRLREDPTAAQAEAAEQAQAALGRAELLVEAHQARVAEAKEEAVKADAAAALEAIGGLREQCAAFPAVVAPSVRRLVALAAEAHAVTETIIAAVDAHEEARAQIGDLISRTALTAAEVMPRGVSLECARAVCNAAIHRDRTAAGRRFLVDLEPHGWLEAVAPPPITDEGPEALTYRAAVALLQEILTHA